jgi:hypothetical protein
VPTKNLVLCVARGRRVHIRPVDDRLIRGQAQAVDVTESVARDSSELRRIAEGRVQCVKVKLVVPAELRSGRNVVYPSPDRLVSCPVEFCVGTRDGSEERDCATEVLDQSQRPLDELHRFDALSHQRNRVRRTDRDGAVSAQE